MNLVSLEKFVLIAIVQIDERGEDVNEHKFTKTCCIDSSPLLEETFEPNGIL